jgi:hypothetical protein
MMKLYTSVHGIKLYNMGKQFWAWTNDGECYHPTQVPFYVPADDVEFDFDDETLNSFKVVKLDNIKFIE